MRTNARAPRRTRRAAAVAAVLAAAAALGAGCGGDDPTNGAIAFARAPAGGGASSGIHLLEPDGSVRALTRGALDRAPAWSPDGRSIAFVRSRGSGQPAAHVVDLEGEVRALPDGAADEVAWSPDGRRLALVDGGELSVAEADGSGRELAAESASDIGGAAWSPDGSAIVFAGGGGGLQSDLYVVEPGRAGTLRLTRLPYEAGSPSSPAWSPDGRRIAFLLPGAVVLMNADGSERRELVRAPEASDPTSLAWSPDGETIAYTLLVLGGPGESGTFLVSPDGGGPRRLTSGDDVHAAWSPDGRELALQRFTGVQRSRLVAADVETGAERPLTPNGRSDASPTWQPGG